MKPATPTIRAHEYFLERYARIQDINEQWLTQAIANGDAATDLDVPTTAVALIAVMDALQVQWLLAPDSIDSVAIFTATYNSLTRGQ